jgi:hypothetical protein
MAEPVTMSDGTLQLVDLKHGQGGLFKSLFLGGGACSAGFSRRAVPLNVKKKEEEEVASCSCILSFMRRRGDEGWEANSSK